MAYQTLYTTLAGLNKIAGSEDTKVLWDATRKYAEVCLDIDKDQLENVMPDNPALKALLRRESIGPPIPLKEYFEQIKKDTICLVEHSKDIFILDEDTINQIQEETGTITLSENSLVGSEVLSIYSRKTLKKGEVVVFSDKERKLNGWAAYLRSKQLSKMTINTMLILDSYLFHNEGAVENISSLISGFDLKELVVPFQLLIITGNDKNRHNVKSLSKYKEEIESKIRKELSINIQLGIVCHRGGDEWHARRVITNYLYIKSDPGFNCFKSNSVKATNRVEAYGFYHDILNEYSEPIIEDVVISLNDAKKLYETSINNEFFLKCGLEKFKTENFRFF